jgi:dihydrolipoamide dehydrogenase
MTEQYDVVVVGGGPAGYVAAIRSAQLGMKTACVDQWINPEGRAVLGGTCLNVGCIPSKSLLESSEHFARAGELLDHGIQVSGVALDLAAMMARKNRVVNELTKGIEQLFAANGIDWVQGRGQLHAAHEVHVSSAASAERVRILQADNIILAPGSSPVELKQAPLSGDQVVDSSGALAFDSVPRRLGVIGAGVIGLELGSVWRRLGAEQVVLLEAQEDFLPMADRQVAAEALRTFTRQGLDIQLSTRVTACDVRDDGVRVGYQDKDGDHETGFDRLIVAVGRRPNTADLAVDEAGLLLDEWDYIHVDGQCRTNLPGVYAIGDAVRGPMLAHKGSEEGIMVAELIAGNAAQVNYATIPSVIYTLPEIAWSGDTEQTLQARGTDYRSGVFPFAASGRARAMGDSGGFIKVLADAGTDRILGVHVIGPSASELVAEGVVAMELGASAEDVGLTVFAHPTLSEAFHEAALAVDSRPIHFVQAKRKS